MSRSHSAQETDEIKALEDRRYQAMLAGDTTVLDELCSDNLIYTALGFPICGGPRRRFAGPGETANGLALPEVSPQRRDKLHREQRPFAADRAD
jgi:hypothetical protein